MSSQKADKCGGQPFTIESGAAGPTSAFLRAWWLNRAIVRDLGGDSPQRRDEAIETFVAQGEHAAPALCRALRGSPTAACAAALGLSRLGRETGVQTVLLRCYDEEWLSTPQARRSMLDALRMLPHESIGLAVEVGLTSACAERHLQPCFDRLTLSLSALRLLLVYGISSPLLWWERGLFFGRSLLQKLRNNPFAGLAHGLTDHIRAAALKGILAQYPDESFAVLARSLQSGDISVMRTAVSGLCKIQDSHALPLLEPIAFASNHPLALDARRAIERIAGSEAESLILVRGSRADANVTIPDDLVRPAGNFPGEDTDALMRSAELPSALPERPRA